MTDHSSAQLLELIQSLENISMQLNEVLKKEHETLSLNDSQQLLALSKTKKAFVSKLESQTKVVHLYLKNIKIENGLYGFTAFLSEQKLSDVSTLLETSWQNIQSLAEDNKTLNHSNGAMIELNRRHVQRSLEVLRGQVGKETSTYGADGQAMKSKISRNISTV